MGPLGTPKPLIGVVHLPALPGAPRYAGSMAPVIERAQRDAETLAAAGFDAVLVENFGDVPFVRGPVPAETVAALAIAADAARRASGLPLGVNVLRNDAAGGIAIAVASSACFVRANVWTGARLADQGIVQSDAARVMRLRASLGASGIGLAADVDVKHSAALAVVAVDTEARDAVERGLADVVIVSGARTGSEAERDAVLAVKHAVDVPVWLGSGVRAETLAAWLAVTDGVIVGSALRADGRAGGPVDSAAACAFVAARKPCA